eukprot:scaffold912_cov108-Isochrysis_galbana.AAC.8
MACEPLTLPLHSSLPLARRVCLWLLEHGSRAPRLEPQCPRPSLPSLHCRLRASSRVLFSVLLLLVHSPSVPSVCACVAAWTWRSGVVAPRRWHRLEHRCRVLPFLFLADPCIPVTCECEPVRASHFRVCPAPLALATCYVCRWRCWLLEHSARMRPVAKPRRRTWRSALGALCVSVSVEGFPQSLSPP